jgi:hypothetical protein
MRQESRSPNLITRLMLRTSASRRIDGLWIGSFDNDAEPRLRPVEEALNLIKIYDPVRYAHLIRDLERIWVTVISGGLAHFDPSICACVLDERHLLNNANPPERIAASIVHEATHARLWRSGIGYEGEELRARVEAVCFRRERAFAAKLPNRNGQRNREQADQKLAAYADRGYWTDEAFYTREVQDVHKTLQYLGMPNWLVRVVMAIRTACFTLVRRGRTSVCD